MKMTKMTKMRRRTHVIPAIACVVPVRGARGGWGVLDQAHQPQIYSFTGIQLGFGCLVDVWQLGAARVDFNLTF